MQATYETDVTALSKLIKLNGTPLSVRWQTAEKGTSGEGIGPTDWELTAALEYDSQTIKALQARMAGSQLQQRLYLDASVIKDWLPDALRSHFVQDDGDWNVDQPVYMPGLFAQLPLQDGFAFISGNWIFLQLHTM